MNMAWQVTGDPILDAYLVSFGLILLACLVMFLLFGRRRK